MRQLDLNYVAIKDQKKISHHQADDEVSEGPPKKKLKGQNKHRPREQRVPKAEKLCFKIGTEGSCPFGDNCCYSHDVELYLEKKPPDIGDKCYLFETFGKCPYSFSCRFGSQHIKDGKNVVVDKLWEESKNKTFVFNAMQKSIQISLRKREYNFQKSANAMSKFNSVMACNNLPEVKKEDRVENNLPIEDSKETLNGSSATEKSVEVNVETEPDVHIPENKKVNY